MVINDRFSIYRRACGKIVPSRHQMVWLSDSPRYGRGFIESTSTSRFVQLIIFKVIKEQ